MSETVAKLKCPKCNQPVTHDDALFCDYCGNSIPQNVLRLRTNISTFAVRIASLQKTKDTLIAELQSLKTEMEEANAENQTLTMQFSNIQQSIQQLISTKLTLDKELIALEERKRLLVKEVDSLKGQETNLQLNITNLHKLIESLSDGLNALEKSAETTVKTVQRDRAERKSKREGKPVQKREPVIIVKPPTPAPVPPITQPQIPEPETAQPAPTLKPVSPPAKPREEIMKPFAFQYEGALDWAVELKDAADQSQLTLDVTITGNEPSEIICNVTGELDNVTNFTEALRNSGHFKNYHELLVTETARLNAASVELKTFRDQLNYYDNLGFWDKRRHGPEIKTRKEAILNKREPVMQKSREINNELKRIKNVIAKIEPNTALPQPAVSEPPKPSLIQQSDVIVVKEDE